MSVTNSIIDSIKQLNELTRTEASKGEIISGRVVSIHPDGLSCVFMPLDINRSRIDNILLSSDASIPLYTPTVDSIITVILFSDTSGCMVQHGGVAKAEIAGNDYGGMLITAKLVEKLNNVENLLNSFFTLYNAHIHPTPSGPSSPTASIETQTLIITTPAMVENTVVTHGKGTTPNATYAQKLVFASEQLSIAENKLNALQNELAFQNQKRIDAGTAPVSTTASIENQKRIVADKQQIYNDLQANPE